MSYNNITSKFYSIIMIITLMYKKINYLFLEARKAPRAAYPVPGRACRRRTSPSRALGSNGDERRPTTRPTCRGRSRPWARRRPPERGPSASTSSRPVARTRTTRGRGKGVATKCLQPYRHPAPAPISGNRPRSRHPQARSS